MAEIILKGKKSNYSFSEKNILKNNGKFNNVYFGTDIFNKQKVIIKVLNQNLSENTQAIERFRREEIIDFEHNNLAQTLEFIKKDNFYFIVRKFIEGYDLKTLSKLNLIKNKNLFEFYIKALICALNGLTEIHNRSILHCDIRPANLVAEFNIESQNIDLKYINIKIIDFGLSRYKNENLNQKTPYALIYSPPEQILNLGQIINETSDLYSLGISFYELITSNLPFYHANPEIIINLMLTQNLNFNKNISKQLINILQKATSKSIFGKPPTNYSLEQKIEIVKQGQLKRYQKSQEMLDDLNNLNEDIFKTKNWLRKIFS